MEGTGSFVCSSGARVLLATPRTRALLSCSYGPMVWRGGNVVGLITCWINRCTSHCYRCVQHLYVLPTIHHRSRSWHQCQAHACGMFDSHASHNSCAEHRHGSGIKLDHIRMLLSVFGGAVLRASLHERQRSLCTGTLTCTGGKTCTDTCLECV